jgi:hypothetical protein
MRRRNQPQRLTMRKSPCSVPMPLHRASLADYLLYFRSSRSSQAQPHAVEFRPAQPYVAPKGFNAVPCNDKTISQVARVFDNLEGKQIWHITAPAGVSISDLKEMTMEHVDNGEAVLQHKGTSYGFSGTELSNGGGACKVLIPHKNGYKAGRWKRHDRPN